MLIPDSSTIIMLSCAFFVIATLYSSVGFGGGSSYLAIMALVLPNFLEIKTAALLCNLVVVSGSSYLFVKEGLFDSRRFLPLALFSVPAAFMAATIHLTQRWFFICLGGVLTISGILLLLQLSSKRSADGRNYNSSLWVNAMLGAITGFLSGLVGIGGGILLSPLLNLFNWGEPRKIAALASFFILVNSAAGLAGQAASSSLVFNSALIIPLMLAVFIGGQIGTRVSLRILSAHVIKGLTGCLVMYIGLKLVFKYTHGLEI